MKNRQKDDGKQLQKPLFSLGKLEDAVIRMAGTEEKQILRLKKKGLLIFCADNGLSQKE